MTVPVFAIDVWVMLWIMFLGGATSELIKTSVQKKFNVRQSVISGMVSVYLFAIIAFFTEPILIGQDIWLIIVIGCIFFPMEVIRLISLLIKKAKGKNGEVTKTDDD